MTDRLEIRLAGERETLSLGEHLANVISPGQVVFLHGELGAGKTTLVRGFLHALGHDGPVKSPTYSLVEHYAYAQKHIYHFDLYRLGDAEELEYMGIRDYFASRNICLVEWAERGAGVLPTPDLNVSLSYDGAAYRRAHIEPGKREGYRILANLQSSFGLHNAP